jgi:23S rRNA maturation mini-RNase III
MDIETYNKSTEFKIMFNYIFQNHQAEAIREYLQQILWNKDMYTNISIFFRTLK